MLVGCTCGSGIVYQRHTPSLFCCGERINSNSNHILLGEVSKFSFYIPVSVLLKQKNFISKQK